VKPDHRLSGVVPRPTKDPLEGTQELASLYLRLYRGVDLPLDAEREGPLHLDMNVGDARGSIAALMMRTGRQVPGQPQGYSPDQPTSRVLRYAGVLRGEFSLDPSTDCRQRRIQLHSTGVGGSGTDGVDHIANRAQIL